MEVLESFTLGTVAFVPLIIIVFLATSTLLSQRFPEKLGIYTLFIFGLAWLSALTAVGFVVFNGPVNVSLVKLGQSAVLGILADRLSTVIVLLVITVSGIVHLYSLRAMQEERHFSRYFTLLSLVTVEVVIVVLANNLLLLGLFWILKGFTLTFLLAHYQERPESRQAAFKKLRLDFVGMVSFVLALLLCWNIFGTFDIQAINNSATQSRQSLPSDQLVLLTVLLFVAAMVKSAQFPLHGWLPQSVEAPTPVSALMHAGLINAGGFLLIRLSPLFGAVPFTLNLVLIVGGITAFYGTLVMLTRNDVKGKLVYSTMGQMGFMMLECGLGAFALAAFHIVAHGLFKATLFLSSGSVIQRKAIKEHLAPPDGYTLKQFSKIRFFIASILASAMLFLLPLGLGFPLNSEMILLAFAWITIIYALSKMSRFPLSVIVTGLSGIILTYLAGIWAIGKFFKTSVAEHPVIDTNLVLIGVGALILIGIASLLLQNATRPAWTNRILTGLYVRLLFNGYGK